MENIQAHNIKKSSHIQDERKKLLKKMEQLHSVLEKIKSEQKSYQSMKILKKIIQDYHEKTKDKNLVDFYIESGSTKLSEVLRQNIHFDFSIFHTQPRKQKTEEDFLSSQELVFFKTIQYWKTKNGGKEYTLESFLFTLEDEIEKKIEKENQENICKQSKRRKKDKYDDDNQDFDFLKLSDVFHIFLSKTGIIEDICVEELEIFWKTWKYDYDSLAQFLESKWFSYVIHILKNTATNDKEQQQRCLKHTNHIICKKMGHIYPVLNNHSRILDLMSREEEIEFFVSIQTHGNIEGHFHEKRIKYLSRPIIICQSQETIACHYKNWCYVLFFLTYCIDEDMLRQVLGYQGQNILHILHNKNKEMVFSHHHPHETEEPIQPQKLSRKMLSSFFHCKSYFIDESIFLFRQKEKYCLFSFDVSTGRYQPISKTVFFQMKEEVQSSPLFILDILPYFPFSMLSPSHFQQFLSTCLFFLEGCVASSHSKKYLIMNIQKYLTLLYKSKQRNEFYTISFLLCCLHNIIMRLHRRSHFSPYHVCFQQRLFSFSFSSFFHKEKPIHDELLFPEFYFLSQMKQKEYKEKWQASYHIFTEMFLQHVLQKNICFLFRNLPSFYVPDFSPVLDAFFYPDEPTTIYSWKRCQTQSRFLESYSFFLK